MLMGGEEGAAWASKKGFGVSLCDSYLSPGILPLPQAWPSLIVGEEEGRSELEEEGWVLVVVVVAVMVVMMVVVVVVVVVLLVVMVVWLVS